MIGHRPALGIPFMLLVLSMLATRAGGSGTQGDGADDPRGSDLRIETRADGSLHVMTSRASLADLFRALARELDLELRATDDLLEELAYRTPVVDLERVNVEELLELLGGAYGVEPHLRDGAIALEASVEPSGPSRFADRKARAIAALRRALLLHPEYREAWRAYVEIGDLHFREGRYRDAVSEYQLALGEGGGPDAHAAATFALGRAHLALGEPVRARFHLSDFARAHPGHPGYIEAYEGIARSFLDEGDAMMASRALSLLLENDLTPAQAGRAFRMQGDAFLAAGRYVDAAESYRAALDEELLPRERPQVRLSRIRALVQAGRNHEAIHVVGKLLDGDPGKSRAQLAEAFRLAGTAFRDLGRAGDEFLAFNRAHRFAADDPAMARGWARTLEEMGLLERAVEVTESLPDEGTAGAEKGRDLGRLLEKLGRYERAREQYARWLAVDPVRATLGMARCLRAQKEFDACLEVVRSVEPEEDGARLALERIEGECLLALDRRDEALRLFLALPAEAESGRDVDDRGEPREEGP